MYKNLQHGFSLIELMIVVAIVSILSSISISAYKGYVARSSHIAGYAEIHAGQIKMETLLLTGTSVLLPDTINLPDFTQNCSAITAISDASAGTGSITCTLIGNNYINGYVITLGRDANGFWSCNSTVSSAYTGKCTGI